MLLLLLFETATPLIIIVPSGAFDMLFSFMKPVIIRKSTGAYLIFSHLSFEAEGMDIRSGYFIPLFPITDSKSVTLVGMREESSLIDSPGKILTPPSPSSL